MKRTLDWEQYLEASARAVSQGVVLLKNDGALPLKKGGTAAVFGRIQPTTRAAPAAAEW